jgi:hypothetical protein
MKPALSDNLTEIYNQPSHSLSTKITAAATIAQALQSSNIFTISKAVSFMCVAATASYSKPDFRSFLQLLMLFFNLLQALPNVFIR